MARWRGGAAAYAFEVFDSVRRIAMTGLIRYVEKTSGPPVAGILLSLVSVVVFREVQPYENPSTNALSTFGQWQLLSTYLMEMAFHPGTFYGGSCGISLNSTTRRHPRLGLVVRSRDPTQIHIRGLRHWAGEPARHLGAESPSRRSAGPASARKTSPPCSH